MQCIIECLNKASQKLTHVEKWFQQRHCYNVASSLALYDQWCLLQLQTIARDACKVLCNAHCCSTWFLHDQVTIAHCCMLTESFVAVLGYSVPDQLILLAKPACSCRVWIEIYISEIAWLCVFCRQTCCTAVVVVQNMKENRGWAAIIADWIKAGSINDQASNPKQTTANTGRCWRSWNQHHQSSQEKINHHRKVVLLKLDLHCW